LKAKNIESNSGTDKGFWPAIIGGILGFLAGFVAYILGGIGSVFGVADISLFYASAAIAIIFSITGIISGTVIDRKNLAGGLMIFSGIMVLFATSLYGLLTFILFLIGGIRILRSSEPETSGGLNKKEVETSSGINKKGVVVVLFIILVTALGGVSLIGDFIESGETETSPSTGDEEAEPSADDLKILEHEFAWTDYGNPVVQGTAQNVSGKEMSYVSISVNFYDEDGVRIDRSFANTSDLADGEKWAFEVMSTLIGEKVEEIDSYEINVDTVSFW